MNILEYRKFAKALTDYFDEPPSDMTQEEWNRYRNNIKAEIKLYEEEQTYRIKKMKGELNAT